MKKLTLIPLALIVLVGALWASNTLLPDTDEFPSNPQTPGTLGYILSLFGPDGTARDSLALGGVSATGYLQASKATCTNPGEVWKGMNTDGTVECGTRGTLLAIGRFSEISGAVEVSTNGTSWTTANTTDTLSEGTIVRTTSGTGTIAFVADDSVLRLDTNTVVQLQSGDLGGNTVAQAILADGRLWGRVLTSTGVNIGGGGLIAGVRGTSISIAKSGNNLTLDIIDSVSPTAATIINKNSSSPNNITIGSGQSMTYTSGATIIGAPTPKSKATLLTDTWIRQNTLSDLEYLYTISGSSDRARGELTVSLPSSTTESTALCPSGNNTGATTATQTYWPSLIGTVHSTCQASNLVAFADYTKTPQDKKMYLTSGEIITPDNGNNYTLPSTLSLYSIYAFGKEDTKLAVEYNDDSDKNVVTIKNKQSSQIGSKYNWTINLNDTTKIEIK